MAGNRELRGQQYRNEQAIARLYMPLNNRHDTTGTNFHTFALVLILIKS
jgi:hypothetical protein